MTMESIPSTVLSLNLGFISVTFCTSEVSNIEEPTHVEENGPYSSCRILSEWCSMVNKLVFDSLIVLNLHWSL